MWSISALRNSPLLWRLLTFWFIMFFESMEFLLICCFFLTEVPNSSSKVEIHLMNWGHGQLFLSLSPPVQRPIWEGYPVPGVDPSLCHGHQSIFMELSSPLGGLAHSCLTCSATGSSPFQAPNPSPSTNPCSRTGNNSSVSASPEGVVEYSSASWPHSELRC